ncbi:hypothetical protein, partial [Corynebacterium casei]|uniref:hypothetical protein n=1 Tax=Corynebacterium casei TaxID=160386 RepID=UPI003F920EFA
WHQSESVVYLVNFARVDALHGSMAAQAIFTRLARVREAVPPSLVAQTSSFSAGQILTANIKAGSKLEFFSCAWSRPLSLLVSSATFGSILLR